MLLQAYERRVLTYVPTNPEGFQVEMGNIGQHYYDWRYSAGLARPQPPLPPLRSRRSRRPHQRLLAYNPGSSKKWGPERSGYSWLEQLEPNNVASGQFNWAPYDDKIQSVKRQGMVPIALVDGCPGWACSRTSGPIRVERVGDFVDFMFALAERYGKPPYNVHYWEFWNEPNSTDGIYNWGTHGDRYATMLAALRPRMKSADPLAQLIMGGVACNAYQEDGGPFNRRFFDDVLDAGGGKYLDAG